MAGVSAVALAAASALLFAVVYQCPWRATLVSAGVAAVGWAVYQALSAVPHLMVLPDFGGALAVGALGEVAAVWRHKPVPLFVVPAIIPFVPGYQAYQSTLALIRGQAITGITVGLSAVVVAGSLAVGLALATALVRPLVHGRGLGRS
jgi:uncharacterized membrane protein YjjB (DUF3815 family)